MKRRYLPFIGLLVSPALSLLAGCTFPQSNYLTPTTSSYQTLQAGGLVNSLAFSPDGKTLAVGTLTPLGKNDNLVQVWSMENLHTAPRTLWDGPDEVESVAFSRDNANIALADGTPAIRILSLDQVSPPQVISNTAPTHAVAYSEDGSLLAGSGEDGLVHIWNARQLKASPTELRCGYATVVSLAFSPDGAMLAAGDGVGATCLWKLNEGISDAALTVLNKHTLAVTSIVFSPDSQMLATGSDDGTISLLNVQQPNVPPAIITELPGGIATPAFLNMIDSVAFSPDGLELAAGGLDTKVRVWDVSSKDPTAKELGSHKTVVNSVGFSPDGKLLATGSDDGTVRLWNTSNVVDK